MPTYDCVDINLGQHVVAQHSAQPLQSCGSTSTSDACFVRLPAGLLAALCRQNPESKSQKTNPEKRFGTSLDSVAKIQNPESRIQISESKLDFHQHLDESRIQIPKTQSREATLWDQLGLGRQNPESRIQNPNLRMPPGKWLGF
jgi:hypothetical protein